MSLNTMAPPLIIHNGGFIGHGIGNRDATFQGLELHRAKTDFGHESNFSVHFAKLTDPKRTIGLNRQTREKIPDQLGGTKTNREPGTAEKASTVFEGNPSSNNRR